MRTMLGCALLMVLAIVPAHAEGKHERWQSVEQLAPDAEILVQTQGRRGPELCHFVSADDATLTCQHDKDLDTDWTPASDARLVFPRSSVEDVWLWQQGSDRHIGLWIGVALSVAFEAWACVSAGELGAVAGLAILAGIWTAALESTPFSPPPRQPVMRRKLVYRMPRVAQTSIH